MPASKRSPVGRLDCLAPCRSMKRRRTLNMTVSFSTSAIDARVADSLELTNAAIVTAERVVLGTLCCINGSIVSITEEPSSNPEAIDCEGDFLLPGLLDVHTDHLEKHSIPREGVFWKPLAAALNYDAAIISAGVTTVFDSLCVGAVGNPARRKLLPMMIDGVDQARRHGLLAADHFLHLRADIVEADIPELISPYLSHPYLRFLTIMDDSVARNPEQFRRVMRRRKKTDQEIDALVEQAAREADHAPRNRAWLLEQACARNIPIANHDDTLGNHSAAAAKDGMTFSEFPLSMEAAKSAFEHGLKIIAGAPNLLLGGSHVGNVAVIDLVKAGYVDMLCSDYVPASILQAIFALSMQHGTHTLPEAVATASLKPAKAFGLTDRGELAVGKRGDILRVRLVDDVAALRSVWVNAKQVK
ncbi:alpha-D-ribose 1-methylphosphonate 5-triphosphate diphosphatase [Rhizobium laguerreae]|uniref:alpha-D-ribose 1-methylphosphonate 5-triphosphate diphosphatase n=1 Tax=Rhizobium laguerreae TaxID=1076926 RepID=UPI00103E01A7|nr:alpha-D-ribose 1-methylphosphonate 5-triphosphate diphosphatase [Rhizobium laguerreae]TBX99048.1 alpha-D-ribose 1-methylphosphonate 5-triphosphate diphosphatase [Rhizobium laguerreae]